MRTPGLSRAVRRRAVLTSGRSGTGPARFRPESHHGAGTGFEELSPGSRRVSGMRLLRRRWHRRIPPYVHDSRATFLVITR